MSQIEVRPAKTEDIPAIATILSQAVVHKAALFQIDIHHTE